MGQNPMDVPIPGSMLRPEKDKYNLYKSIVQIKIENKQNEVSYGSGFFIRFMKNNKPFYCLMTNEHVIDKDMINNEEKFQIIYDNQSKSLNIELNRKERLIQNFKGLLNIDATIVEIIEKDNINKAYFLLPDLDYKDGYEKFIGKKIEIPQFPGGRELHVAEGEIKRINLSNNKYQLVHLVSTERGSSGSPIILKGKKCVLGIHRAGNEVREQNYGDFIGPINDIINQIKRNGEGVEYYGNGKIKYEGNYR